MNQQPQTPEPAVPEAMEHFLQHIEGLLAQTQNSDEIVHLHTALAQVRVSEYDGLPLGGRNQLKEFAECLCSAYPTPTELAEAVASAQSPRVWWLEARLHICIRWLNQINYEDSELRRNLVLTACGRVREEQQGDFTPLDLSTLSDHDLVYTVAHGEVPPWKRLTNP